MKTFPVKAVANEFLAIAQQQGVRLNPCKIQQLVYFSTGWMLGLTGRPLFSERILATRDGPLVREIYFEFRKYGTGDVTQYATEFELSNNNLELVEYVPRIHHYNEDALLLIQRVWSVYGRFTSGQISKMIKCIHGPWYSTYRISRGKEISIKDIQVFFENKANANSETI